ncbi:OLC1v1035895C1 [Oldenlandia corymbosa var. corymbosa]|uniref:OLC1v1035895C1 n=1 Tax=Oldenlandia corymbosa var. corymbosa TaxID=529605 RepID=A0AAV1CU32_OLDCO|nr:OLC1v1035895C1 [Oldenlandia corymbosa var. corymbosa]
MELPEGTLTLYKKQKSTQEEQSPVQTPRTQNLWRKQKRKKSTPTGNPKQLVVADDNDDKKPKKKTMKPENNKLIGQDPRPISSEDSVKKFETRMTPNHLFLLITEINKPTDLTKEPDTINYRQLQRQAIRDMGFGALLDLKIKNIPTALCNFLASNFQTGARQVPLNGNNVLDIKQEDVVAVLDLPRGPKPVEEFKQNDPAITDHAEMVDAFKKRMGYSNKFLPMRSTAAQLIAGRKDFGDDFKRYFLVFVVSTFLHGNTTSRITMNILKSLVNINEVTQYNWCQYMIDALVKGCKSHHDGKPFTGPITFFLLCYLDRCEYERAHPRSFHVIKSWDQKMLNDRIRLQESNFTDIQTLERLKKLSSAASRDEQPEAESQKEDTQGNPNTQQVYIREKEMELRIEPDEQAKQIIKILSDAMLSMSRKMPPPSVGKFVPTSKEVLVDEQQTQPQGYPMCLIYMYLRTDYPTFQLCTAEHATNVSTTEKKRSHQDSTGWDSAVTSTYTKRTRSTGTRKRKALKEASIPSFNLGIFSSQEDSYETTQEKNTQEDVTVRVDLDKDVNETIEAEEYPVPSALDETKNLIPSIDEIITRASAPASESSSDTEKLEIIATVAEQVEKNSEMVEAVPLSIIPPDWNVASTTGRLLMLDKNECTTPSPAISKKAEVLDEGLTKTVEKNFLFEFGKIVWADRTAFYSMREGTWIENSIIDAWAVILNKEEAKSDSPSRIFFGVFVFGSNKEEIEFTFYERLALELEEQGLSVGSLIVAKAIYFPVHYREHYFLYVLLVQEMKVLAFNNLHAKDLDYYKPTKDLLFQFFKMYLQCVFPNIELVTAQYTFTEVTLPSHNDKKPNAEDCGIFTMHHMEKYDGGDYEKMLVIHSGYPQ